MIVGITGIERKLGQAISSILNGAIDLNLELDNLSSCDVFINNLAKGNLQELNFKKVFELWKNEEKTIVNIISTVVFDETNSLGSYGDSKISFNKIVQDSIKNSPNKLVRVINIYPSTLSSNKEFDSLNKVDIQEIARLLKFLLELPQEIEIREISIYPTVREKKFDKCTVI